MSAFDNLDRVAQSGGKVQKIDTTKLNQLEAVLDNADTGHVSIRPKDMARMKEWQLSRTAATEHEFTTELRSAIVEQIKIP